MICIVDLPTAAAHPVFLGFVFILFVLTIKKMKKIVFNALWISLAAVLFPIAMNRLLGFSIPVDANSIIFYLTIGLGAYFLYLFARAVHTTLGIAEKIASPMIRKIKSSQTQKREGKIDRLIKDKENEEKLQKAAKKEQQDKERLEKIMKKKEAAKRAEAEYIMLKGEEERSSESRNIIRRSEREQD